MQVVSGKSILNGIAIGPVHILKEKVCTVTERSALTPEEEQERFDRACETAKEQLTELYEKSVKDVGEESAAIFDIHRMFLEDEDFLDAVKELLDEGTTAEYAVTSAGKAFSDMFAAMDDPYMKARAIDIKDVSRRTADILMGCQSGDETWGEPAVLVADDLTPSQTVQLDKSKLLGFITRQGSSNSHTAILARTMNIPALIGVDFSEDWEGKTVALDGFNHCAYIDPDEDLLERMRERRREDLERRALLQTLKGKPDVTKDGRLVRLYANIGSAEDTALVLENDAQGIGLFRSEFLYLNGTDYPTEEQQFAVYKYAAQAMAGKKVIIRTLDIGADKQASYFMLDKEENPAMGYRAIRICLTRREMFKTQLRALLRAAAFGSISVMFPMIISVDEVRQAKALLQTCRAELAAEGIEAGPVEIGVMIETPAAVMIADELAQEVDFFSLGTNDLTQYTLAIDRQNAKLDRFYDPHHPAVLRMIHMTVQAGHRHGCWVGICGELGADMELTETFLCMGVDELSVAPSAILPLRQCIRNLDLSEVV